MSFDIIEIQAKIEEIRLKYAIKFDNFLSQFFYNFLNFLNFKIKKFCNQKYFLSISCFFIFLISVFIRSNRDFGYESSANLEIFQKIFNNNFSLIVFGDFLINFIGIFCIFLSYKILKNAKIDEFRLKIIIISLFFAYFIRIYDLQFNEYFTKNNWFLAFSFLYISCDFLENKSKKIIIFEIILAILIIFLDYKFALFIAIFQAFKIYKNRNFLIINISIFLFSLFFIYQNSPFNFNFLIFKENIFIILLTTILFLKTIKIETRFLLAITSIQAIFLFSNLSTQNNISILFSFLFPILFLLVYEKKITKINWLSILILLTFILIDFNDFRNLFLELIYFFWVLIFFEKSSKIRKILISIPIISLFFLIKNPQINWLISAILLLIFLQFNIIKNQKSKNIILNFCIAYILALILIAIFNYKNIFYNYETKNKIEIIKKYAPRDVENIAFLSNSKKYYQAIFLYNNKKSNQEIANKTKLIFVEKNNYLQNKCAINLLENNLKNDNFRKYFLDNYQFLTEIYEIKEVEKISDITKNSIFEIKQKKEFIKTQEFEIYIRKNDDKL